MAIWTSTVAKRSLGRVGKMVSCLLVTKSSPPLGGLRNAELEHFQNVIIRNLGAQACEV